ncbi:ABC transporter permease [Clostridium sp. D2Q-14]|uniref:ABC transporter permease n=1 Tax=Anaeromonas gelatinilytica TaxID=2683194 RepID=UPI00193C6297|nr:ABC transporter permease [Anaeromonas gelatinilytica]MBS4535676.1 ABC transporter permease [Anaeromonas gelatinilytica]
MKYFKIILAEIKMNMRNSFSYKTGIVSEIVVILILYIGLIFFESGNSLSYYYPGIDSSTSLLLVGYIFWSFSSTAVNIVSSNISKEASQGTLEVKYMCIVPIYILMIGNFISSIIIELVEVAILILVSVIIFDIPLYISANTIVALMLTLIGMYGIGVCFGGVTFKEKQIGKFIYIFQIALLVFSDVLSVNKALGTLRYFIPLNLGVDIARSSISGLSIPYYKWLYLGISSIGWIVLSFLIFRYFEKKSKINGVLGHY